MPTSKRKRLQSATNNSDDAKHRSKVLKALHELDGSGITDGSPAAATIMTETAGSHATSDNDATVPHNSPSVSDDTEHAAGSSGTEEASSSPKEVFASVSGNNPFASLFPGQKAVLKGALAVTANKNGDIYEFTGVPTFNILQAHRPTEALRMLKCTSHDDNVSFKSPPGGIINVALADPSTLAFDSDTGYLCSTSGQAWIMSSVVGQTTYFSSGKIPQICVLPSAHGWHRLVAVLAAVSGNSTLYFQSFRGGVTFGINRWKSNGIAAGGIPKKGRVAPICGSLIAKEQKIPVFDGCAGFQLGHYWETRYTDNVPKDSTVMLLFSIKKGNLSKEMQKASNILEGVEFAIYFNILGIVVLAEPADHFSEDPSGEEPEAFGVDNILQYPDSQEQAEAEEEVAAESDEGELKEPVL